MTATLAASALAVLPDDVLLQVIGACNTRHDVPLFEEVKGLVCSKALRQQFHRLRPLVGVRSLAVVQRERHGPWLSPRATATVQRSAHGPWHVVLLYEGVLTSALLKQAQQGHVRSIDGRMTAHMLENLKSKKAVERAIALLNRVLPELAGADCPLFEPNLAFVSLYGAWASVLNGAAVCSTVLRTLDLHGCELRGPLPQLRLPALQYLQLSHNNLSGGLQSLQDCTALLDLDMSWNNRLTGDLEPLRGCTALRLLRLDYNKLEGGLEPLQNCTALQTLSLGNNLLCGPTWTGDFEPLRGCLALQDLDLSNNELSGSLEPLWGCTLLRLLSLNNNSFVATDEDRNHFETLCGQSGGLTPSGLQTRYPRCII